MTSECTVKSLKIWSANTALPALCLNVDFFQTKPIKGDYPIYSSIAHTANPLQISSTCSIPHSMKQIQNDRFEERRGNIAEKLKQL